MIYKKNIPSFSIFIITTVYLLKIGIRNYLIFWCWPISVREFSHNDSFPRGRLAHYWRHWGVIFKEDSTDEPFCDIMKNFLPKNTNFTFDHLRWILLVNCINLSPENGMKMGQLMMNLWGRRISGRMVQFFIKVTIFARRLSRIHALRIVYLMSFQWVIYLFFSLLAHQV